MLGGWRDIRAVCALGIHADSVAGIQAVAVPLNGTCRLSSRLYSSVDDAVVNGRLRPAARGR